jgi:hypothetical protein
MTRTPISAEAPPRVLISYTHDSPRHKQRVLELSNRLVEEGVDCHIDQYTPFPAQGWPRWMLHEIDKAEFVVVVCTESYQRRALGYEEFGRGLGATWEGMVITQELYNAGTRNTKFVPVIFASEDAAYIPIFLQGYTHYDVGTDEGYEQLYSLLTNRPQVTRPALGQLRPIPATRTSFKAPEVQSEGYQVAQDQRDNRMLVLLRTDGSALAYFIRAERVDEEDQEAVLILVPENGRESAALEALRGPFRINIMVAHGLTAYRATVESLTRSQQGTTERWTLRVRPEDQHARQGFGLEVTFGGVTPDDQAEMRARRILLNEHSLKLDGQKDRLQEILLDPYVSGEQYGIRIAESPFPELFNQLGHDPATFVEAARLTAVLLLRLTNVVAQIFKLELTMPGQEKLSVEFEGQRQKAYANVPATVLRITGLCSLT